MGMTEPAIPKTAVPRGVQLSAILPHGEVVCALALSHPFQHVFTGGRVSQGEYILNIHHTLKTQLKNFLFLKKI
jgi:hypothetical protein